MKRRFRGASFVLRKKYVVISLLFPLLSVLISKADIPKKLINSEMLFSHTLLCLGDGNFLPEHSYIDIFKSGSLVFAYAQNPAPEKEPEPKPEPTHEPEESEPVPTVSVQEKYISIPSSGLEMRNQTSFSPDTSAMLNKDNNFLPVEKNSAEPQVLIFHTHTTESFYGCDRTDNEELNVVSVGKVIADILTENGINTIHCKTVHDYDYNGSYSKSYDTVQQILADNPSIKIVLDVHRDGITYEDGSGLRVISDINGKTAGQFMLVVGTDEGGLYHPAWEDNLSFAVKLQARMNEKYPGLARPLNLRQERFNQNLSPGMIIVECGGNGNSLAEVKYGAELFSSALYDVITQ